MSAEQRTFRSRAQGRVQRELNDGKAFASDSWRSSRLRSERWFVVADSNGYVLRPVRNAILRLRSTTLHSAGQPGAAERLLGEALRWPEPQGSGLGRLAKSFTDRIAFPLPTDRDVAVLSYGEIDMRTYVLPQITEHGRTLDEVLDAIADGSIRLMEYFDSQFPGRTAFLSIKPPVGDFENPDYPCPATISQRVEWTADLNHRIATRVAKRSFGRVGIADYWNDVARADGAMPPEYSDDYVHLSVRKFRIVRDRVRETIAALEKSAS